MLMDCRQVYSLWKVLPQQSIDLLVRATLPRALRIAEIDFDIGCQREALVIRHLLASIPGQRFVELPRQFVGLFNQCINDRLGVFAFDPHQHAVAGVSFHQGADLAVVRTDQQVALPMPGYDAVLSIGLL